MQGRARIVARTYRPVIILAVVLLAGMIIMLRLKTDDTPPHYRPKKNSAPEAHHGNVFCPYSAVILEDVPTAYFHLQENNIRFDDTVSSRTATVSPGVVAGGSPLWKTCRDTTSAKFRQKGGVVVPYDPALNSRAFTVDIWARLSEEAAASNTLQSVVSSGHRARGYAVLVAPTEGKPGLAWQLVCGTATRGIKAKHKGWATIQGPAATPGEWTHLVGTYDGHVLRLYVNGTIVTERKAKCLTNNDSPLRIAAGGGGPPSTGPFGGEIGEVSVFAQALPPARVRMHWVESGHGHE